MRMELLALIAAALTLAGCIAATTPGEAATGTSDPATASSQDALVVAGGCFWCLQPLFARIRGVVRVEVGYAGGATPGTTYEAVSTGRTGHAEAVKIWFDPKAVSAEDLLRMFLSVHDPTTLNRQGNDIGTQYRSAVFYASDAEKARAERIIREIAAARIWDKPLVTTIEPLVNYTRAEEYHQDYYAKFQRAAPAERARMNAGYCQVVIGPKIAEFRRRFAHLLKP
jgi:peptide-methionine (S)-S-oxide reductase